MPLPPFLNWLNFLAQLHYFILNWYLSGLLTFFLFLYIFFFAGGENDPISQCEGARVAIA